MAVVLAGEVNRWNERKLMSEIISEICLRENCLVLTTILSEQEYKEQPFALFRNIVAEGIPV